MARSYGGFDWGGANAFANDQQRRDTPFQTQMIKDAFSGFGGNMGGAMGQIGSGLRANADAIGAQRQRDQATRNSFTQGQGAVPMGIGRGEFNQWLQMEGERRAAEDSWNQKRMQEQMNFMNQALPYMQGAQIQDWNNRRNHQLPLLQGLFGGMSGLFGGGGSGFNTNFGASGSSGGQMPMGAINY